MLSLLPPPPLSLPLSLPLSHSSPSLSLSLSLSVCPPFCPPLFLSFHLSLSLHFWTWLWKYVWWGVHDCCFILVTFTHFSNLVSVCLAAIEKTQVWTFLFRNERRWKKKKDWHHLVVFANTYWSPCGDDHSKRCCGPSGFAADLVNLLATSAGVVRLCKSCSLFPETSSYIFCESGQRPSLFYAFHVILVERREGPWDCSIGDMTLWNSFLLPFFFFFFFLLL